MSMGFCSACLDRRVRQRLRYGLLILALIWIPVFLYSLAVYRNDALNAYWQFAGAAPAVLIGLYLSAFFYDWVANAFTNAGRCRTGEVWAQRLARD